jgi:CoA:oxalate CoA-transferase
MNLPLEGIRVIDLTHYQQGPIATQMLADMGAEVIKVEPRNTGDPGRQLGPFYFQANNRNKKSITVDIKTERGKEIVYRLVEKADLFAQNFRPGVAERLGFGYDALSCINPRIIYLTGSAFGLKGPMGTKPGFDGIGQAMSGILSTIWFPEGVPPTNLLCSIADMTSGFLLAFGAMVALHYRDRTGQGQEVDGSLLGSTMSLIGWTFQRELTPYGEGFGKVVRGARVSHFQSDVSITSSHFARDGKPILLLLTRRATQEAAFAMLDLERFLTDPRRERGGNVEAYIEDLLTALDEKIRTKDRDEWLRLFDEAGVIAAPIHTILEAAAHPQVLANEYVAAIDHPKDGRMRVLGLPIKLHKTPGKLGPSPELGQNVDEVLEGVAGYTAEEILRMKKDEII